MMRYVVLLIGLAGCARAAGPGMPSSAQSAPTSAQSGGAAPVGSAIAEFAADAVAEAASPDDAPSPSPHAQTAMEGDNFIVQAQTLFQIAACGDLGEIPARFDADVIERHCQDLHHAEDEYRHAWIDVAKPMFDSLRPSGLPSVVVYPFGGGDLITVLATFPDATEVTTISLEPAGDIRPIETIASAQLSRELYVHRDHLKRLFLKAHSRTDNLRKESKTILPGELVFDLVALAVYGYEPIAVRYFRLLQDGSLEYLTTSDLDAHTNNARSSFDHVELMFRRAGDAKAPIRILRHIRFNLDDTHIKADPSLLAHLGAKGTVASMTKAATHLLWDEHFSLIRGWLVDHIAWMASDSTGIPPRIATASGLVQETYGIFDGPAQFGAPDARDGRDLKRLFALQPKRDLAFRYGYPDRAGHAHLIVTHRP